MKKISGVVFLVALFAWTALGQEGTVTTARANLRGAPSTGSRVLTRVVRGESFEVLKAQAPWYLVQTKTELVGWIHGSTIRLNELVEMNISPPRDPTRYTVIGDRNFDPTNQAPPPPSSGKRVPRQISGGILNGKAISLPRPPYPPAARAVRATGAVTVQVLIDESGTVVSASPVSGHPLLRAAAVQAARSATFSPTYLDGRPVKVSGVITYNFVP
jgi:TonB family protein